MAESYTTRKLENIYLFFDKNPLGKGRSINDFYIKEEDGAVTFKQKTWFEKTWLGRVVRKIFGLNSDYNSDAFIRVINTISRAASIIHPNDEDRCPITNSHEFKFWEKSKFIDQISNTQYRVINKNFVRLHQRKTNISTAIRIINNYRDRVLRKFNCSVRDHNTESLANLLNTNENHDFLGSNQFKRQLVNALVNRYFDSNAFERLNNCNNPRSHLAIKDPEAMSRLDSMVDLRNDRFNKIRTALRNFNRDITADNSFNRLAEFDEIQRDTFFSRILWNLNLLFRAPIRNHVNQELNDLGRRLSNIYLNNSILIQPRTGNSQQPTQLESAESSIQPRITNGGITLDGTPILGAIPIFGASRTTSAILQSSGTQAPVNLDTRQYEFYITSNLAENDPLGLLNQITTRLNTSSSPQYGGLRITFTDSRGIDATGLSRNVICQLFKALCTKENLPIKFSKISGDLYLPIIHSSNITNVEEEIFKKMGNFMMFCLNINPGNYRHQDATSLPSTNEFPIGINFPSSIFSAIGSFGNDQLDMSFNVLKAQSYFVDKFLDVYSELLKFEPSEFNKVKNLRNTFDPFIKNVDESNIQEALDTADDYINDKTIADLKEQWELAKMLRNTAMKNGSDGNHLTQAKNMIIDLAKIIQETLEKYRDDQVKGNMVKYLAPLHAIAKGMKTSRFNAKLPFWFLKNYIKSKDLSEFLQGTCSSEDIISKLSPTRCPQDKIEWIKEWIRSTSVQKRKNFLQQITGSEGTKGVKIEITSSYSSVNWYFKFETCFNKFIVNFNRLETKESLFNAFNTTFSVGDSRFNIG